MSRPVTTPVYCNHGRNLCFMRLALFAVAALILPSMTLADDRPNIVMVFIDDMGWGDFSCFGNHDAQTPNIDRLAAEGVRFEQFYVNSPICSPSRTALSTGQYPQRWRITSFLNNRKNNTDRGMAQWLDPKAPMLARSLQSAGYATGHFGKWHMGGQRDVSDAPPITDYGFDESLTNFEGMGPKLLPETLRPGQPLPGRIWEDAVLEAMDKQFGKLFDRIRNDPTLKDNTLVLVCSDNGPEPGAGEAGPFRGYKTHLYEGGLRSPLIAWGPKLVHKSGHVDTESVFSAIDLAPTLLTLTGTPFPEGVTFDGEALVGTLLGDGGSRKAPICFRRPPDRDSFYEIDDLPDLAVRKSEWKLLCEYDGSDAQLYNLNTDRAETTDVAADNPKIVAELTELVVTWHNSLPPDNGATYKQPPKKRKAK